MGRKTTKRRTRSRKRDRMHFLLYSRKEFRFVKRRAPSPGQTSPESESCLGLPGSIPVARGDVLAYSCAAARDLHPLPCSSPRLVAIFRLAMERTRERIRKLDECKWSGRKVSITHN